MKAVDIINEGTIFEHEEVLAENAGVASDYIHAMLEDVKRLKELVSEYEIHPDVQTEVDAIIAEMNQELEDGEVTELFEKVQRQFRRYGDKFLRQYRCTTGQKAGRLVSSPEKCGIRKDPKKVRQGKKSARVKKGQRVRKTLFTKRKTQSKRLSRLNKVLRGDT